MLDGFGWLLLKAAIPWFVVLQMIPVMIWFERKGSALIADRVGPNRAFIPGVGLRLAGMVHNIADVLKLVGKEGDGSQPRQPAGLLRCADAGLGDRPHGRCGDSLHPEDAVRRRLVPGPGHERQRGLPLRLGPVFDGRLRDHARGLGFEQQVQPPRWSGAVPRR